MNRDYMKKEFYGENVYKMVIEYMKEYRKHEKITQQQLAEKSGIKQPMIARIENGKTDPQLSTFTSLLNQLGLKIQISPLANEMSGSPAIDFVKSINILDGKPMDEITHALLVLIDQNIIDVNTAEQILDRRYSNA